MNNNFIYTILIYLLIVVIFALCIYKLHKRIKVIENNNETIDESRDDYSIFINMLILVFVFVSLLCIYNLHKRIRYIEGDDVPYYNNNFNSYFGLPS